MGRFRHAAAGIAALGLALATPAAANSYDLVLTGALDDLSTGSVTIPGLATIGFGSLALSGLPNDFQLAEGDVVTFTVTLDGLFTVPASATAPGLVQFFGFNLDSEVNPVGASVSGEYATFEDLFGTIGVPLAGGCGNCLSLITGNPDNSAWGFTGFSGTMTVDTLDEILRITQARISYQIVLEDLSGGGGVIPEPATWAMLIAGFGLVGAGLRRRRAALTLA
jgi:hypothetical protein